MKLMLECASNLNHQLQEEDNDNTHRGIPDGGPHPWMWYAAVEVAPLLLDTRVR